MRNHQHFHITGLSLGRLAALADGVFAVAMTLLALDLRVPAGHLFRNDHDLIKALLELLPNLAVYFLSFLTLGILWVRQQTQFNQLRQSDRNYSWINIAFLCAICLVPFTTALVAHFITLRAALLIYWFNILLLGGILWTGWHYALRGNLLRDDVPPQTSIWIKRRIVISQCLYALGAALCVVNNYTSLGFIVLVQLNYAIAPRIWPLSEL
jgi:uncharacterized membrane protein